MKRRFARLEVDRGFHTPGPPWDIYEKMNGKKGARKSIRTTLMAWLVWLGLALPALCQNEELRAKSLNVVDGFGAFAVLTGDPGWERDWQKPRTAFPDFQLAPELTAGAQATLIVGFANASVVAGRALIGCDLEIAPPHAGSTIQRDIVCFDGTLDGPTKDLRLTVMRTDITAEKARDDGLRLLPITVRDRFRHVDVPLYVRFGIHLGDGP